MLKLLGITLLYKSEKTNKKKMFENPTIKKSNEKKCKIKIWKIWILFEKKIVGSKSKEKQSQNQNLKNLKNLKIKKTFDIKSQSKSYYEKKQKRKKQKPKIPKTEK